MNAATASGKLLSLVFGIGIASTVTRKGIVSRNRNEGKSVDVYKKSYKQNNHNNCRLNRFSHQLYTSVALFNEGLIKNAFASSFFFRDLSQITFPMILCNTRI